MRVCSVSFCLFPYMRPGRNNSYANNNNPPHYLRDSLRAGKLHKMISTNSTIIKQREGGGQENKEMIWGTLCDVPRAPSILHSLYRYRKQARASLKSTGTKHLTCWQNLVHFIKICNPYDTSIMQKLNQYKILYFCPWKSLRYSN